MPNLSANYVDAAGALLRACVESNRPVLETLGPIIGRSIAAGGILHTFGSGHSEIIAREVIGRAGGLVCVNGIPDPTSGFVENLVGYGTRLVERHDRQYRLDAGETIIVISNSGKNSSPIEIALYAKAKGLTVVGLTSVAMSGATPTVHPSGRRLHEIADHVLDNQGVPGDAIVEVGPGVRAGPTSTLAGALLLNCLALEVVDWLRSNGHRLPILQSQNIPGAIEHNRALAEKYRGRLSRQLA
jgi:uncharacterized phosphosugar-binding protein